MRESGIPRRTYQEARRRAFAAGWVIERYVPDSPYFGAPYISFVQARPFAERTDELVREWMADPRLTTLWRTPDLVFGIFFSPTPLRLVGDFHQSFCLTVDARAPTVPVYFDFEGVWVEWTRLGGTHGYPRPLPGAVPPARSSRSASILARHRSAARELDRLASQGDTGERSLRGGISLARPHRLAVRDGAVQYRLFANLGSIPAWQGRSVSEVLLIRGALLHEHRPEDLFRLMVRRSRPPFLFASDGAVVMAGVLGPSGAVSDEGIGSRTLGTLLEEIDICRIDLRSLQTPAAYRFGPLLESLANPPTS